MVYNDLRQTEFDFQSFGTDSALYTIMKSVNTSSTGIERLGLRATERTTTSSTGIARLGLRDTERTATTGEKMDHFDSEITCEEFYSDEDRLAWEERTLFFKEKESTMEALVSQAVVTTHDDSARPVGMVP